MESRRSHVHGGQYGVYSEDEQTVLPFLLLEVNLETKAYHFNLLVVGVREVFSPMHDLPWVPQRISCWRLLFL